VCYHCTVLCCPSYQPSRQAGEDFFCVSSVYYVICNHPICKTHSTRREELDFNGTFVFEGVLDLKGKKGVVYCMYYHESNSHVFDR
jgi:hypothetical protein